MIVNVHASVPTLLSFTKATKRILLPSLSQVLGTATAFFHPPSSMTPSQTSPRQRSPTRPWKESSSS